MRTVTGMDTLFTAANETVSTEPLPTEPSELPYPNDETPEPMVPMPHPLPADPRPMLR